MNDDLDGTATGDSKIQGWDQQISGTISRRKTAQGGYGIYIAQYKFAECNHVRHESPHGGLMRRSGSTDLVHREQTHAYGRARAKNPRSSNFLLSL